MPGPSPVAARPDHLGKGAGPEHPHTAISLAISPSSISHGRLCPGPALYQRALTIIEKTLGPDLRRLPAASRSRHALPGDGVPMPGRGPVPARPGHAGEGPRPAPSRTASSLNDLDTLYDTTGDYEPAEPLHQRALPSGRRPSPRASRYCQQPKQSRCSITTRVPMPDRAPVPARPGHAGEGLGPTIPTPPPASTISPCSIADGDHARPSAAPARPDHPERSSADHPPLPPALTISPSSTRAPAPMLGPSPCTSAPGP